MLIYAPEHFSTKEFVPQTFYEEQKARGKEHLIWLAMDIGILKTHAMLRARYGPTTINTWMYGGDLHERGLRIFGTKTGASLSQHLFGRATDSNFKYATPEEIREDMRKEGCFEPGFYQKKPDSIFRYIRCVECTIGGEEISWFHMDTRPITNTHIYQLHL